MLGLGPSGGPRGVAVSYERDTPVQGTSLIRNGPHKKQGVVEVSFLIRERQRA